MSKKGSGFAPFISRSDFENNSIYASFWTYDEFKKMGFVPPKEFDIYNTPIRYRLFVDEESGDPVWRPVTQASTEFKPNGRVDILDRVGNMGKFDKTLGALTGLYVFKKSTDAARGVGRSITSIIILILGIIIFLWCINALSSMG